ncbi:sigma-70 family RNA polymerase sigma factor [Streptomyces sp. NPDC059378]|uniref:sigma-70 family RNA polymerase sigma factor n=1 Tax=Streptomyces sp. NPDC059378 TaxID=3346815 RepID=UPI0036A2D969
MPADAEVATTKSATRQLHDALVEVAGSARTLTLADLRSLLTGTDRGLLASALGQVLRDGITLPEQVVRQFGLREAVPAPDAGTLRATPPTSTSTPPAAAPSEPTPRHQKAPSDRKPEQAPAGTQHSSLPGKSGAALSPRFTIRLGQDAQLNYALFTVRSLQRAAAPTSSALPAPAPRADPATAKAANRSTATAKSTSPKKAADAPGRSPDSQSPAWTKASQSADKPAKPLPDRQPPTSLNASRTGSTPKTEPEPTREHRTEDSTTSPLAVRDPVKQYLKEISRHPLLSPEREVELGKDIEAGLFARERLDSSEAHALPPRLRRELQCITERGHAAFTEFVEGNLRLVTSMAKHFVGRGLLFLDLIQEGNAGLVHAVQKFDHTKGFRFSTYATWHIRQAISRGIAARSRVIRLPDDVHNKVAPIQRANRARGYHLPGDAPHAAAARAADLPVDEVQARMSKVRETVSLETLAEELGETAVYQLIAPTELPVDDEAFLYGLAREEIHRAFDELDERQLHLVRRRHGFLGSPATLDEIGKEVRLTRERVRQILAEADALLDERLRVLIEGSGHPVPPPRVPRGGKGK